MKSCGLPHVSIVFVESHYTNNRVQTREATYLDNKLWKYVPWFQHLILFLQHPEGHNDTNLQVRSRMLATTTQHTYAVLRVNRIISRIRIIIQRESFNLLRKDEDLCKDTQITGETHPQRTERLYLISEHTTKNEVAKVGVTVDIRGFTILITKVARAYATKTRRTFNRSPTTLQAVVQHEELLCNHIVVNFE